MLCIINTLLTFKFTCEEVNLNSHAKKLKLSIYTLASGPNFPEMRIKMSHWELENVFYLNSCFSLHSLVLMGEGAVVAFQYYWLPLVASIKKVNKNTSNSSKIGVILLCRF